jgi:hypothetical protein
VFGFWTIKNPALGWVVFRQKPLREYVNEKWETNLFVVIGLIIGAAVVVILLKIILWLIKW